MKVSTIGARLAAGFAAVVLVLCCVGVASSLVMTKAKDATTSIAVAYLPEMNLATSFEREILNARINFIYHVTIQKDGALDAGWARFRNARALMPKLKDQAGRPRLAVLAVPTAQLERDLNEYGNALTDILARESSGRNHDPDFDAVVKNWAILGNKLVETAAQLNASSSRVAEQEALTHASELGTGFRLTLIGSIGAIVLAVGIAAILTRRLNTTLRNAVAVLHDAATNIVTATRDLTKSSESLAAGATEQAASVERSAASCEEISTSARRCADGARVMLEKADRSRADSQAGMDALAQMVDAMAEVTKANDSVTDIIKVIDSIAFQTNILALNAAVEAARAGAAGQGFAVVADEVRTLAQRSAEAAQQTAQLIGESAAKASASGAQVERVASIMREVAAEALATREIAEEVSAGNSEQTLGLEHIVMAIGQIESVTQRVAAGAEQSSAAVTELASQAASMKEVADGLAALVG